MSVILTSVGITFPDTTSQTTAAAGEFTSGTVMLFQQTAAPTGWTKSTTHDNKALRLVNGTVGSGGSAVFTTAFGTPAVSGSVSVSVSGTVDATTLTTAQLASHSHTHASADQGFVYGGNRVTVKGVTATTSSTNSTGSNSSHTHSWSGSGSGSLSAATAAISVAYVDVIIATKN